MRYRFYYKKYEESKLATFISSLQSSFWGAVAYAIIPVLPLLVLGLNLDIPFLLILSGIIWIILIIFIMSIDTNKLAQRRYSKKLEKLNQSNSVALNSSDLNLARALLIHYYMDLAEEMANNMLEEEREYFKSKIPLLKASIKDFILKQEKLHGTAFLTEDAETNASSKFVNTIIGKRAYCLTFYYALGFDEKLKLYSIDEVSEAIQYTVENTNVGDDEIELAILNYLSSKTAT